MNSRLPTSIEASAETVEQAIEKGLDQLGVGPSQVIVEVLEEPSRGLFGLGAKQARVRLQLLAPPPRKAPPAAPPPTPPKTEEPAQDDTAPSTPPDGRPSRTRQEPVLEADEPVLETQEADTVDEDEEDEYEGELFEDEQFEDDQFEDEQFEDDQFEDEIPYLSPSERAAARTRPDVSSADEDDFFNEDGTYEEGAYSKSSTASTPASTPEAPPKKERPPRPKLSDRDQDDRDDDAPARPRQSDRDRDKQDTYTPARPRPRPDNREAHKPEKPESGPVEMPPVAFKENAEDFEIAEQLIVEMIDIMQLDADIDVFQAPPSDRDGEDGPPWILNIEGDSNRLQYLLDRRGEALTAMQYLVRLMVSKQTESRANVVVDVNDNRNSRSDKLEKLAHRMADQAVETGRVVTLEPMPAHERRIVHMVLRRRNDVKTESKGQGDDRRVTIYPKNGMTDDDY